MRKKNMKLALLAVSAAFLAAPALADEAIQLNLKDHKFTPSEIHVKANQPSVIVMNNQDATAEEFDSTSLKVEKVVPGNSSGNVRLRPLAPGRYPFMGEFHAATAQGVVIAE
jgi:hypothetical protein